eukprot:jgi/Psemu1/7649/gm1.7649_g
MYNFNYTCILVFSIVVLPLHSKWIASSAFQISSSRLHAFSPERTRNNIVRLDSTSNIDTEDHAEEQTPLENTYTIYLADNREDILRIKTYRFGGITVEEHMEANPELNSRDEALRSLTSTYDDSGKGKVYYGNGSVGESIQFFALADDITSPISRDEHDKQHLQDSYAQIRRVVGSVEAVREPTNEEEQVAKVSIELKNLSVHKDARRRGIGKALTQAVQNFARSQVSTLEKRLSEKVSGVVHLLVEVENEGAMRLYDERGFAGSVDPEDPLCKLTWWIGDSPPEP